MRIFCFSESGQSEKTWPCVVLYALKTTKKSCKIIYQEYNLNLKFGPKIDQLLVENDIYQKWPIYLDSDELKYSRR